MSPARLLSNKINSTKKNIFQDFSCYKYFSCEKYCGLNGRRNMLEDVGVERTKGKVKESFDEGNGSRRKGGGSSNNSELIQV